MEDSLNTSTSNFISKLVVINQKKINKREPTTLNERVRVCFINWQDIWLMNKGGMRVKALKFGVTSSQTTIG